MPVMEAIFNFTSLNGFYWIKTGFEVDKPGYQKVKEHEFFTLLKMDIKLFSWL